MGKKIYDLLTNNIFKTCYDFIGGLALILSLLFLKKYSGIVFLIYLVLTFAKTLYIKIYEKRGALNND